MRQYLSNHVWWRVGGIYTGIIFIISLVYMHAGNGVLSGDMPTTLAARQQTVSDERIVVPTRITVPSHDIDLTIVRGEYDAQKGWSVERSAANYIPTTMPFGESGAMTIYGHDMPEIFHHIKDIQPGTEVTIVTSDGATHHYVRDTSAAKIVAPDDVSILSEKTDVHKIYLLTCDGWRSEKRYVATLLPVEKKT